MSAAERLGWVLALPLVALVSMWVGWTDARLEAREEREQARQAHLRRCESEGGVAVVFRRSARDTEGCSFPPATRGLP